MPEKCTGSCTELSRLEQQIKEMQQRNREDHKELRDRLSKVEMANAIQNGRHEAILTKLDDLSGGHGRLADKLEVLQGKPGKSWESIVEKAVWAATAAVNAFLLGGTGLS